MSSTKSVKVAQGPVWKSFYNSNGHMYFGCCADGFLREYSSNSSSMVKEYYNRGDAVFAGDITSDSAVVAVGLGSGKVTLWNRENGKLVRTMREHTSTVFSVKFADSSHLLTSSADRTVVLWDTETKKYNYVSSGHQGPIYMTDSSRDRQVFVTASFDRAVGVWDLRDGGAVAMMTGHTMDVLSCKLSSDGAYVLTTSADKTLRIWDLRTRSTVASWDAHADSVDSCSWSPCDTQIATCSVDGTVKVWDCLSSVCRNEIQLEYDVECCTFSPQKSEILCSGVSNTITTWKYTEACKTVPYMVADIYFVSLTAAELYYCFTDKNAFKQMVDSDESIIEGKVGNSYVMFPYSDERVSGKYVRLEMDKYVVITWRRSGMATSSIIVYEFMDDPNWAGCAKFTQYLLGDEKQLQNSLTWHRSHLWTPLGGLAVERKLNSGKLAHKMVLGRDMLLQSIAASGAVGFMSNSVMEGEDEGWEMMDPVMPDEITDESSATRARRLSRNSSHSQEALKIIYKRAMKEIKTTYHLEKKALEGEYKQSLADLNKMLKEDMRRKAPNNDEMEGRVREFTLLRVERLARSSVSAPALDVPTISKSTSGSAILDTLPAPTLRRNRSASTGKRDSDLEEFKLPKDKSPPSSHNGTLGKGSRKMGSGSVPLAQNGPPINLNEGAKKSHEGPISISFSGSLEDRSRASPPETSKKKTLGRVVSVITPPSPPQGDPRRSNSLSNSRGELPDGLDGEKRSKQRRVSMFSSNLPMQKRYMRPTLSKELSYTDSSSSLSEEVDEEIGSTDEDKLVPVSTIVSARATLLTEQTSNTYMKAIEKETWDILIQAGSQKGFSADDIIQYQGTAANSLYLVVSGRVNLRWMPKSKKAKSAKVVCAFDAPCFVSVEALMPSPMWPTTIFTISAASHVQLFEIERSHIARLVDHYAKHMVGVLKACSFVVVKMFTSLENRDFPEESAGKDEILEEVPIRKAMCATKAMAGTRSVNGALYVTSSHVFFRYSLLGVQRTHSFPLVQISSVAVEDNHFTMNVPKRKTYICTSHKVAADIAKTVLSLQDMAPEQAAPISNGDALSKAIMSDRDLEDILVGSQSRNHDKGEVIIGLEKPTSNLFQVCQGSCNVVRNGEVLKTLQPGDIFGEISFLLDCPTTAQVVASSDVVLYEIPRKFLDNVCAVHPALCSRLYQHFISQNLTRLHNVKLALANEDRAVL